MKREISCNEELLKFNPKDMTVSDISRSLGFNRNTADRYFEIMVSGCEVKMR